MATRTWLGNSGNYTDPTQWSSGAVPISGDVATINSGTVNASGITFVGVTVNVGNASGQFGTLALNSDTLDAGTTVTVADDNSTSLTQVAALNFLGTTTNNGVLSFGGRGTSVQFAAGASLVNNGSLNVIGASPQVQLAAGSPAANIVNNGAIRVINSASTFEAPLFNTSISGTGTISLSVNSSLDLKQAVGSGQTVAFTGGVNASSRIQLDSPTAFGGTVTGFVAGDQIIVAGIPYDHFTYASTGTSSGTLTLFSGATSEGSINLSGLYSQGTFGVQASSLGTSGLSNVTITTSVLNPATGSTTSAGPGPVYRFFDKTNGTHFFTSLIAERDNVNTTLGARYSQETNNFGTSQATDAGAVLVYRFFDTRYGTHFFTSDANEANGLRTPGSPTYRSDLTYEPGGNFYEHSTAQAGDVTVFRFFDRVFGTHFYTGDAAEFAAITTPGTAAYRSDLAYEPTGNFFAPAGTFT